MSFAANLSFVVSDTQKTWFKRHCRKRHRCSLQSFDVGKVGDQSVKLEKAAWHAKFAVSKWRLRLWRLRLWRLRRWLLNQCRLRRWRLKSCPAMTFAFPWSKTFCKFETAAFMLAPKLSFSNKMRYKTVVWTGGVCAGGFWTSVVCAGGVWSRVLPWHLLFHEAKLLASLKLQLSCWHQKSFSNKM